LLDSSRDLEPIHVKSFINRFHLVLLNAKIPFPKFLENRTKHYQFHLVLLNAKTLTLPLYCSVLQGSVSEYCFHNCKAAPVIIVPGKGQFKFFRLCLDPGKVEEKVTSNTVAQCRIFRLFVVNIVLP